MPLARTDLAIRLKLSEDLDDLVGEIGEHVWTEERIEDEADLEASGIFRIPAASSRTFSWSTYLTTGALKALRFNGPVRVVTGAGFQVDLTRVKDGRYCYFVATDESVDFTVTNSGSAEVEMLAILAGT